MKIVFSIAFVLTTATFPLQADEEGKYLYKEIPDVTIGISNKDSSSLLRFCKGKPTIISLAYSQCAGICYPFVITLRDEMPEIDKGQKGFRVLILSFDEKDTKENMATMAVSMNLQNDSNWIFGTIEKSQIHRFTQSLGFEYLVDSLTGQIDHPPIVVGVNKEGKIVRIIKNNDITRALLWQVYHEIQGEFVPLYRENSNVLVSCFAYDSKEGKFRFSWGILLLYLPVALGAVIVWRIFSARKHIRSGRLEIIKKTNQKDEIVD